MSIPSLKKVNLSQNITELRSQLDLISFDDVPLALNIAHLRDQKMAIHQIEKYIKDKRINVLPYPISVITTEKFISNKLLIMNNPKFFPKFFIQKLKPLNLKENALLKKINLLQEKIKNTDIISSKRIFESYAKTNRKINILRKQEEFINGILSKEETTDE